MKRRTIFYWFAIAFISTTQNIISMLPSFSGLIIWVAENSYSSIKFLLTLIRIKVGQRPIIIRLYEIENSETCDNNNEKVHFQFYY